MRLPDPLVFFIDRCLGTGDVPAAVKGGLLPNETIQLHDDLFDQDAEDVHWLTHVGKNRWVGLTKDDAIRRRPVEIGALLAANSAVFISATRTYKGRLSVPDSGSRSRAFARRPSGSIPPSSAV